ncbi:N-methylhydantoinase A/oxoprolinase/acetone carboxylase, beta subunit [Sporobacter termitidis DSM 10068]|uniref:N-methylhydantoinase A/oxoprolinase/acetone carboxylase, beta subunit n=1 Tax=Sporobacter termitidis DSM 10068 TaxID=1123282 RepID=A0A1M5WJC9_9FIRM|nr:hydantoinase/oxoprolinase family protein [Sporobacter termitidis]SHH87263.1 N-methylhydantoinase A/oxoprolinase/acetone carboxylase, beta subunit [Sporobacter termitidis DSM 10068]
MKIGIGIDTGGTCTDAVAYDFDSERVLAKGKALTTRENLSIGIGQALDMLPPELIREASLVSLSTTLATNACVENKGCRAKLLIFGLTDENIRRFNAEAIYGLKSDNVRGVDTHGSADGLIIDEPDWDILFSELGDWLADADALAAAELYSMNNGAPCEKHAKLLLEERYGLPFVSASDLTSEINVLTRGATALLNARLLPIVREFIEAALSDFSARQCRAPVMVVRSDGSLMSAKLSLSRPVETILSGPAASVLAGRSFAGEKDYLIIDMGGTTTDVSVVRGQRPVMADSGIQIGGWRTHVKGVFVDTFALGGDSAVRMKNDIPQLFPRRVMPICSAARRWPEIKAMLLALLDKNPPSQFPIHEFFYLVREPAEPGRYDKDERALIEALRKGPRILSDLKAAGVVDLYHLNSERLEAEGIVMRCGLTPTDFMHIKGDYTEYDGEASALAARFLLRRLGREDSPEDLRALAEEVYGLVGEHLYVNLLRILIAQQHPAQFAQGLDLQTEFLIRQGWAKRDTEAGGLFRYDLGTKAALVGIGAPTHVFLPAVAKALGTEYILPENAEVANALGALKADINAVTKVEISKALSSQGETYYVVHAPSGSSRFDSLDEALDAAKAASEEAALKEARARGALGELAVTTSVERHSTLSKWGTRVDLGCAALSEVTVRLG